LPGFKVGGDAGAQREWGRLVIRFPGVEHARQQQPIGTFLTIDQMGFKRSTSVRRERVIDVALRDRVLVDVAVIHAI
jgi:hypothetical protein